MKGLNIEDKDYISDEFLDDSKEFIISTCSSEKRSLISKNHLKNTKKIININTISNVNNNFDISKISKESPEKLHNSLQSYYLDIKNKNKKKSNKNLRKDITKKKPFDSNNLYININNINTYLFFESFEIPEIKEFNSYYEIPLNGKYDFIFLLRGGLSKNEWFAKTRNIRKYPRHLKNTLFFQSQIKYKNIHKQNFSKIYQIYLMIKNRGYDLYKNKKFRESLEHFNYAYGLFKWIEFKNKNISIKINSINNEIFSILDEDIEEKKIPLENNNDEKCYRACLIYILEIMAYCHIELRLYSSAIECLDECVNMAGNYFPDVYLRRAQARIYNKKISDQELKIAEKDINKAINLALLYNSNLQKKYNNNIQKLINTDIYYKTKIKYNQIIKKKLEIKVNNIRKLLLKDLNLQTKFLSDNSDNNNSLDIFSQDNEKQYKILKEIKKKYTLAVKFFTETKNQSQLDLTYKEYESFYETFYMFKKFYKFSVNSIEKKVIEQLNDKEKKNLFDINNIQLIEKNKKCICNYIFTNGNYNAELYKYVVDKLFEEEKNKKEENKSKFYLLQHILNLSKGKYFMFKISLCFIIISFVSIGFQIYYLKHVRGPGFTDIDK